MTVKDKFTAVEGELSLRYIDRDDEIHGLSLAALSGHHMLFLGPPGNAKSMLIRDYSAYLGSDHFSWLMTKFTTMDEIVGPWDIAGIKAGKFQRILDHKLTQARTAFLDEIFKANSAILNSLLGILQERTFHNDGTPVTCPLLFAVASSNELPEEDEGLTALYDRFLLRYQVGYIQDIEDFTRLMKLDQDEQRLINITDEDLTEAVAEVKKLILPDETVESLGILWQTLRGENIQVSDRRYKQMLKVMAAEAWLLGEAEIVPDSLLVASHVLWTRPEQIRTVKQIVQTCVNADAVKAQDILDAANELWSELKAQGFETGLPIEDEELHQRVKQLKTMKVDLAELKQNTTVTKAVKTVDSTIQVLVERLIGN